MSNQKKKWVNSVFRQISVPDGNTCITPKKKKQLITRHSSDSSLPLLEPIKTTDSSFQLTNKSKTFYQENWLDSFAPKNSDELAVHPKKINELQQWLLHCQETQHKEPSQLCILTGPPGCGKTATVRVLAKEFDYSIQEWVNPLDQDIVHKLGDSQSGHNEQSINNTQIDLLKNFLFKASRYKSILEPRRLHKCLLMMEDFPNFLIKNPSKFKEILQEYRDYGKSPWIFIVTDSKNRQLNIDYNLFTDQIKTEFLIHEINFNATATTLMKKAIKRFSNIMKSQDMEDLYKTPSNEILDYIISSSHGDIRNALINLHYMALKVSQNENHFNVKFKKMNELTTQQSRKTIKKLKTENISESTKCHNNAITTMHALGRVFNPKYQDQENHFFVHNPEVITETLNHEPRTYVELLQANYLEHFKEIEDIAAAADGLSLSELVLNEYRDNTLAHVALNLAVRNLMVRNKAPAAGWLPIKSYKRLPSTIQFISKELKHLLPEHHNIVKRIYVTDYGTYIKILSQKFQSN